MTYDLVTFLRVRFDERESEAQAVMDAFVVKDARSKRQILDLHERSECRGHDGPWIPHGEACTYECAECYKDYPCTTIRLFGLPYDHEEGYREEWKP